MLYYFSGIISSNICNQGDMTPNLNNNNFCPPYPLCFSNNDIGEQNTSECYLIYDLNNDQLLNVLDIMIIVNSILDNNFIENGDFNTDGILNISDIIFLIGQILD